MTTEETAPSPLLDWLRLMRLPNVFTAIADVAMGFCFVLPYDWAVARLPTLAMLALASAALYTAGMVLNDVFDVVIDQLERPERPLPSGRISVHTARSFGFFLLTIGVILPTIVGFSIGTIAPGIVAAIIAVCVLAYNIQLKHTVIGPLGMGACRFFNVLLGMSVVFVSRFNAFDATDLSAPRLYAAGGIAIFIAGVTWFARSEAEWSSRWALAWGLGVMIAGVVLFGSTAFLRNTNIQPKFFVLMVLVMVGPVIRRGLQAIFEPSPAAVQGTVKSAIMSLIPLHAAMLLAVSHVPVALAVASLLVPMLWLGRKVYST